MRLLLIPVLLAGCGAAPQAGDRADDSLRSHKIVAVTDADAPTIAMLKGKGLVQVDQHETSGVCGDNCIADGFDALYFGKLDHDQKPLAYEFICPVADGAQDAWKCRPTTKNVAESGNG